MPIGHFVATTRRLQMRVQPFSKNAGPVNTSDQIGDAFRNDDVLQMCLKVPVALGRDLVDVHFEQRGAEEWVRVGNSLFRPQQTVPWLDIASLSLEVGPEGWPVWRPAKCDRNFPASGLMNHVRCAVYRLWPALRVERVSAWYAKNVYQLVGKSEIDG
jgi:hypothetical protein